MIHRFTVSGVKYLYDVNSGSLHVIDDLVWDVLDHYPTGSTEETVAALSGKYDSETVRGAVAELAALRAQGLAWAPDPYPDGYQVEDNGLKALCLHVAHDCNLACRYCFAGGGPFGGDRSLMPLSVAKQAIDFLVAQSPTRNYFEVDFFGGEPLINFPVVRDTIAYADTLAGKRFRFTLTTNCVNLTPEITDFLNERGMQVILSIDGRPQVHDRMRPDRAGHGSYARVAANALQLAESRHRPEYKGEGYFVRGTYTQHNLDFAEDVRHFVEAGFKHISVEPVVDMGGADYAIHEGDLERIGHEYERLADYYIQQLRAGTPFTFFHFNLDPSGGACAAKRVIGCGACYEYMAVAPNGDIYPCHQFVGRPDFLLGNVARGLERSDLKPVFRGTTIYAKEACRDCWARFLCSGGCHANAELFHHDLSQPYELGCELQKRRLECGLHVQATQAAFQADE